MSQKQNIYRLKLKVTGSIRDLLSQAKNNTKLSEKQRQIAKVSLVEDDDKIVWDDLRQLWRALNEVGEKVDLYEICKGSGLALEAPAERKKSPELQQRLEKLQMEQENREYKKLVKDVTRTEDRAEMMRNTAFSTYQVELAFGMEVITFLATGYYMGYLATSGFENEVARTLGGVLGMILLGLVVPTLQYMIKTSQKKGAGEKYIKLTRKPYVIQPEEQVQKTDIQEKKKQ